MTSTRAALEREVGRGQRDELKKRDLPQTSVVKEAQRETKTPCLLKRHQAALFRADAGSSMSLLNAAIRDSVTIRCYEGGS